ncbi:MAG TPA: TlpA disulfide reductase family protein [Vicinamibacterales bacterium]|nr:TlpA disulfide reductase family protein [Vicinamibacterales bacterium]
MNGWRALAASLLFVWPAAAGGQTLGEIAKKIEDSRRGGAGTAVVYDERDMNPALARRDLLGCRLDAARWLRFVEVDRQVARALAADPLVLRRLEGLNYISLRSVGHFFRREPSIARVLEASQLDAHDYATTYLAAKLAISTLPDAQEPAVVENAVFLKTRRHEVKALAIPLDTLSLHALGARSRPPGAAAPAPPAPTTPRPPSARAAASPRANDDGPIDMSEGAEIPDFDFVDFDGRRRQLSDFRGRFVMLDFWGSWCPPCRAEVPFVKDAYARFGSRGFEVLGMDSERDATVEQVRAYLNRNGVKWTFATPDSVRGLINDRFQIPSFPRVVLLDPQGRVVEARNDALRGETLARTLDRILPR